MRRSDCQTNMLPFVSQKINKVKTCLERLIISYELCKFSSLCDKNDINRLKALPSALNVSVFPVCDFAPTNKSPVF